MMRFQKMSMRPKLRFVNNDISLLSLIMMDLLLIVVP